MKKARDGWLQASMGQRLKKYEAEFGPLVNLMVSINSDMQALGTDQPATIWTLAGDLDDPYLQRFAEAPNLLDDIVTTYDQGLRFTDEVNGLVVGCEVTRHLLLEELRERNPLLIKQLEAQAAVAPMCMDPDHNHDRLSEYYYGQVVPQLGPAQNLPASMKVEMRTIFAVLKDGRTIVMDHDMAGEREIKVHAMGADMLAPQRSACALYMFMNNVRPDPECPDPITVVSDHKTLEALANLPTADK